MFAISGIQLKSMETDTEIKQMFELVDENFKTLIITLFHMFKKTGKTK
jgi:hypothetical protein